MRGRMGRDERLGERAREKGRMGTGQVKWAGRMGTGQGMRDWEREGMKGENVIHIRP